MRVALHISGLLGCLMACNCFLFGDPEPQDFGPEPDCQTCEGINVFELDPTCELMGDLDISLGQGADGFRLLSEGTAPTQYSGPQGGGGHSFIAVRIGGVDPSRYDRVEVTLTHFRGSACEPEDVPCDEFSFDERLILGDQPEWRMVDGMIEEYGIRMIFPEGGRNALQAIVRDPCGQEGFAFHQW